LTGSPTKYFLHNDIDSYKLWNYIYKSDQKNFVICCAVASASDPEMSPQDMKAVGLVDAHAYSLISAKIVTYKGRQTKLVQVRNPWGKREWKGDWSDSWPGWTDKVKE
jgi:hypothetical protein